MSTTIRSCGGTHEGPHGLPLNRLGGGSFDPEHRIAALARIALVHAVEDEVADALETATAVLDRADRERHNPTQLVEVSDDELAALKAAVRSGAEYMDINSYGDDQDFPEDAYAASVLHETGAIVTMCWKERA